MEVFTTNITDNTSFMIPKMNFEFIYILESFTTLKTIPIRTLLVILLFFMETLNYTVRAMSADISIPFAIVLILIHLPACI